MCLALFQGLEVQQRAAYGLVGETGHKQRTKTEDVRGAVRATEKSRGRKVIARAA